jgi:hypothetical protein
MRQGLLSIHPAAANAQTWATLSRMNKFQQFEVWQMEDEHWDLISSFQEFDTAYAITQNRKHRVRLLKVTYESGQSVAQEVIAEFGANRRTE